MYKVYPTKQFQKSLKKVLRSGKVKELEITLTVKLLASGGQIPQKYKDHSLHGLLSDSRECHIRGDLLLVYKKINTKLVLVLLDIGSHSEIL